MKTFNCCVKDLSGIILPFLMLLCALPCFAADDITADYSGWKLAEAFADLARKGKLNIVGDFPATRISIFRLNSDTYIEEALNLLARSNDLTMRKSGEIWVALPATANQDRDIPVAIARSFTYRSPESLKSALQPFLLPGVSLWIPPFSDLVTLTGRKDQLDECKKVVEALDTPIHALEVELSLREPETGRLIASCSFVSMSGHEFHIAFRHNAERKTALGIYGTCRINDEGIIYLTQSCNLSYSGRQFKFAHDFFARADEQMQHHMNLDGSSLVMAWRARPVFLKGRLKTISTAVTHIVPARSTSGHFTSYNSQQSDPEEDDEDSFGRDKTITVVSAAKSPLLEKHLVLDRVSLPDILQKLALEEDITLVCSDNVAGEVSAFCHGERLDREELLTVLAKVKGYGVFSYGSFYTVANPDQIKSMAIAAAKTWVSPALVRLPAKSALSMLENWFKKTGMMAVMKAVGSDRFEVLSDAAGCVKAVCAAWATAFPEFFLGLEVNLSGSKLAARQIFSERIPFDVKINEKSLQARGRAVMAAHNPEDGLRSIDYQIEASDQQKNYWQIRASMLLPEHSSWAFASCEGAFPLQFRWLGDFSALP